MSNACISEVHSFTSYKCETPNQSPNSLPSKTLDCPKMAPLVQQQKTTESDALMSEHPDEQYSSTETNSNSNSSENNSDIQQDVEDSANKLRNLPLSDSPPKRNGPPIADGAYGLNMNSFSYFGRGNQLSFPFPPPPPVFPNEQKTEINGLYHCQKCEFVGHNDDELHFHSRKHDPYECGECGLMSSSPQNLIKHIKAEHPSIAASKRKDYIVFHEPESLETIPELVESSPEPVECSPKNKRTTKIKPFEENIDKPRRTTCKICNNFVGNSKKEYYDHLEEKHSENGKLLRCSLCPFIALYKHHLEYHFRNHFGSKPFQCEQCKYVCVNRSMLNSHMKSHSNVYQYSCQNCQYLTKYLHSLKMHLRKYNHVHGQVLNPDGTVNKNAMIDTHGKKRGPRGTKRKSEADHTQERESPKSKSSPSPPSACFLPIMPSSDIRILLNPQIHNNYSGNLCVRAGPSEASNYVLHSPPTAGSSMIKCHICGFETSSLDMYNCHLWSHSGQGINPFFQPPFAFSPFGPSLHTNPFSGSTVNQQTTVERRNINEGQNMDVMRTWYPIRNQKYNEEQVNNGHTQTGESERRFPIGPAILANIAATNPQYIGNTDQSHKALEEFLKTNFRAPNRMPAVKEETPEYMNGIASLSTINPIDNGPLDLTIKPTPPAKKSLETGARRGLIGGAINRASSGSPKFGSEESKVTTQKTNRRKGRAFKLNQYAMEIEPPSDGAETGLEKMPVFYESTSPKPAVRNSVPRINFKPTLNTTKWNGHDSQEPEQKFLPYSDPSFKVTSSSDPQTTGQKARGASDDCWCPHCDMYSASPRLQEYHSSYHSKNDPFTCAKCGLRCHDKDGLNAHIILGSRINGTCINSIEEC